MYETKKYTLKIIKRKGDSMEIKEQIKVIENNLKIIEDLWRSL